VSLPRLRPVFSRSPRRSLVRLLFLLMLQFRPEGIFKERPGVDRGPGLGARLGPLRARAAAAAAGRPAAGPAPAVATGAAEDGSAQ